MDLGYSEFTCSCGLRQTVPDTFALVRNDLKDEVKIRLMMEKDPITKQEYEMYEITCSSCGNILLHRHGTDLLMSQCKNCNQ